jgi:hypothetical protein
MSWILRLRLAYCNVDIIVRVINPWHIDLDLVLARYSKKGTESRHGMGRLRLFGYLIVGCDDGI